jgi:hypothetical protein
MSVSNGKITIPVNISDIAQVLGSTSDLTRSSNINRWAKYKPVRSTFDLGSRPSDWWKADNGWCGLSVANAKVSNTTDVSGIASKYTDDKNNGWDYLPPRKGQDASRVLDFAGYNHNVEPFVGGYTMPEIWSKAEGEIDVSFIITMTGEENADYLSYQDLPLQNFYLGIALISSDGSKVYRCTSDTMIDYSGFSLKFSPANIDDGQYAVYPFISDKKMTILDGGFVAANVYTLPNVAPTTLVIQDKGVSIVIQGKFPDAPATTGLWALTLSFTVTNNTQSAIQFSTNYVSVRYSDKKFTDTLLSDEKLIFVSSFALSAGQSTVKRTIVTGISDALKNDCLIWVSLSAGLYLQSAPPLQSVQP